MTADHTRRTDPFTSHQAGEAATKNRSPIQKVVLKWAATQPLGFTDVGLVSALGDIASPSGLRSRRAELTELGLIQPKLQKGEIVTKTYRTNRRHIVWILPAYQTEAPPPPAQQSLF